MNATLFDAEPAMRRTAVISDCGRYRYRLGRENLPALRGGPEIDPERTATFVMLNPSTADASIDDPTIRRCVDYARRWGFGALLVVNLYAWRATDPRELRGVEDPIGPDNDAYLTDAAMAATSGSPLVAAWGANAAAERIAQVLALPGMDRLTALAVTKAGHPGHPLYLKADLMPQPWRTA